MPDLIIYKIRNNRTGESYIGSTTNYKGRQRQHLHELKANRSKLSKLQKSWNSWKGYGFSFSIVEKVEQLSSLTERENYWITKLNTIESGLNTVKASTRR